MFVDIFALTCKDEGDLAEINWTLQQFNIDELTDYYKNPRSLSDKEFKQLKTSLDKFGMIDKPIVNADSANTIIGGHQRKHVLEASGVKEIECWVPDRELSDKEVEELNIRLNKNTGSWDFDVLANEFELDDLLDWGFDKGELDLDLWAEDAPEDVEPQIDKAEELRVKWGVETGQLWQLGEHRLICGDCTDKAVVERVMGGEKADMVMTDPPYGIDFDTDYTKLSGGNFGTQKRNNHPRVVGDDKEFDPSHLMGFENIVLWGANCYPQYLTAGAFLVWDKRNAEGRTLFSDAEIGWLNRGHGCYIFSHKWDGLNRESERGEHYHPTQKPAALWEWVITEHVKEAVIIYDPYCGAGGVLIACERLGRKCRAVEISPAYVAVAIQRWVDVTGQEPVLLSN